MSQPRDLAILAQTGTHDRLHAMVSLTSSAVAVGRGVYILLTHAALRAFLHDELDESSPGFGSADPYQAFYEEALELERLPSLHKLFQDARTKGKVRVFGCQASVALWRRYSPEQLDKLDAIIGHATFLKITTDMQLVFI